VRWDREGQVQKKNGLVGGEIEKEEIMEKHQDVY